VGYSGPEPGKGQHRYVLLLFQQPSFQTIEPPSKRANFQTKQVRLLTHDTCPVSSEMLSHLEGILWKQQFKWHMSARRHRVAFVILCSLVIPSNFRTRHAA
jgi:hypothetical protein